MLFAITLLTVYLAIWLWLFRDSYRSQELHPLFGSQVRARRFWIVMFLACNPLLVVLYAVFGKRAWAGTIQPRTRQLAVVAGALLSLWFQLGMVWSSSYAVDAKLDPPSLPWGMSFQVTTNSSGTSLRSGYQSTNRRAPRTLRVLHGGDVLSRACATHVARDLAAEWWTDKVELWPREKLPEPGALAPDFYINLVVTDSDALPTPMIQIFRGHIAFTAGVSPYSMGSHNGFEGLPQTGLVEYEGEWSFYFKRLGSALGGAVYGDLAEGFGAWFRQRVISDFRESAELGQRTVAYSGDFDPREQEVPDALQAMGLEPMGREHARFVHERALFRFQDDRPAEEVLLKLGADLNADGWNETWARIVHGEASVLLADKAGVRVTVGKWPRPTYEPAMQSIGGDPVDRAAGPISSSDYIVTLESRFTNEEYEALAMSYAAEPFNVDGLFDLTSKVRSDAAVEALRKSFNTNPRPDSYLWLCMARVEKRAGNMDAARRCVQLAYALARIEKNKPRGDEAKRTAKSFDLSLPSFYESPDLELVVEAGFPSVDRGAEPQKFVLSGGGAVRVVADCGHANLTVLVVTLEEEEDGLKLQYDLTTGQGTGTSSTWSSRELGETWTGAGGQCPLHVESELRDGDVILTMSNKTPE